MATNDQSANARNSAEAYEQPTLRRNRGMISIQLTLGAGVPQRFGISGDYFHVLTAPVDDLQVRFDDGKADPVYEGVGWRVYYGSVELSSATGQTVVVLVGFGSVFDGRASANVNVTANVAPGNTVDDGGDVSCPTGGPTQLATADTDRLYIRVANPSSNVNTFRIGTSGVDGTSGDLLEPGMSLPIATTAAVYAYNTGSTTESVTVSSVKQV
jgi:hypothetical protein